MHQVRIFTGLENDTARLTKDINDWLKSSNVKVVNIFGNIAPQSPAERSETAKLLGASESNARRFNPSDILIVVVYTE